MTATPNNPVNPLEVFQERFSEGGSYTEFLLVFLGIAVVIAAAAALQRIQQFGAIRSNPDDPAKLFRRTIKKLRLPVLQRDVLMRMSHDLKIQHPAALLLSFGYFEQHAHSWLNNEKFAPDERDHVNVRKLAKHLYNHTIALPNHAKEQSTA